MNKMPSHATLSILALSILSGTVVAAGEQPWIGTYEMVDDIDYTSGMKKGSIWPFFTFRADGTFTGSIEDQSLEGTYEADGVNITMLLAEPVGSPTRSVIWPMKEAFYSDYDLFLFKGIILFQKRKPGQDPKEYLSISCNVVDESREECFERWELEVRSHLAAIRACEIAYFSERNSWVGNQPFTPVADRRGNSSRETWDGTTRFAIIGFAPSGEIRCSYQLGGSDYPSQKEGFVATANCDLDEDGEVSVFTISNSPTRIVHSGDDH